MFQDIWAKPSDVGIAQLNAFFQDANVYYCLENRAVDIHSITEIFRAMKSYLLVAMYSEYSPGPEASNGHFVDEKIITDLARQTVRIFAGAYDQEGFVVWRR